MKNYTYTLGGGIHRSPEFEKKGLGRVRRQRRPAMRPRLHLLLQPGDAPLPHSLPGAWPQSLRHRLLHRGPQHPGQGGPGRQAATAAGAWSRSAPRWMLGLPKPRNFTSAGDASKPSLPNPAGRCGF